MNAKDIYQKEPITWTIEDVRIWLNANNFCEYADKFVENFISGFELLDLSEEDLISMGIVSLGHRKRILKAIATVSGVNLDDFDLRSVGSSESDSDASYSSRHSQSSVSSSGSSKSNKSEESSVKYSAKCKYKNDIRMIELKKSDSLRRVKSKIKKVYGRRLDVKIRDADNDLINIKTDRDLKTAIENLPKPIRIELSRRKRKGKEEIDKLPESETAILDTLLGACVIIGDDCYIKYFNPAAEKLFGYNKEEVLGKNCNILMPSGYATLHDQFISNYLKTGRSKIINSSRMVVGKHKSGKDLSVEISLTETKTANRHTFTSIFKHFEENQNNENSKSVKEQFKTLEVIIDPVVVINETGQIVFANSAALKFFQYSEDELFCENVSILMPSPHKENHNHYIQNYLTTSKTTIIGKNRPLICECADGNIKPIYLTVSESYNSATKKRNFIGVFRERETNSIGANQSKAKSFLQREREIVNGLVVASVIIDHHGIIQAFNKSAQQIFGYDLAEVLGQNVRMLIGEDEHAAKHDNYIQNYLTTGISKIIGAERVVKCKTSDGKIFSSKLTVVVKKDPGNSSLYFTGMFHKL